MTRYDGRFKALEKKIPRPDMDEDTEIVMNMDDGTYRVNGLILTEDQYFERVGDGEIVYLWRDKDAIAIEKAKHERWREARAIMKAKAERKEQRKRQLAYKQGTYKGAAHGQAH